MGHKIYGEDEPKRSHIAEFCENFFAVFMAFSSCIGGWLVYFGMPVGWMFTLSTAIAFAGAWHLSKSSHYC